MSTMKSEEDERIRKNIQDVFLKKPLCIFSISYHDFLVNDEYFIKKYYQMIFDNINIDRQQLLETIENEISINNFKVIRGKYFDVVFFRHKVTLEYTPIFIRRSYIQKDEFILSFVSGYDDLDKLCVDYAKFLYCFRKEQDEIFKRIETQVAVDNLLTEQDFLHPEESKKPIFNSILKDILLTRDDYDELRCFYEINDFGHITALAIQKIIDKIFTDYRQEKTIFICDILDELNEFSMQMIGKGIVDFQHFIYTKKENLLHHVIGAVFSHMFTVTNISKPYSELGWKSGNNTIYIKECEKYIIYEVLHRDAFYNYFMVRDRNDMPGATFEDWCKFNNWKIDKGDLEKFK